MNTIQYTQLAPHHFDRVIELGNAVHGDNYLDHQQLDAYYQQSFANGINASWVALDGERLVGFRLTWAAGNWTPDQWCTTDGWGLDPTRVCYFKCNTVDSDYRGHGIGSTLLKSSIDCARDQGAQGGLAHIWLASPGNSAYRYFSRCGGEEIKRHPNKWRELAINDGYDCPVCDELCSCTAAEMLIRF
ncbi:GNAT family N-acetyltransferase [Aestuariibacter halophilus]|uniref:GNAT family N-acetyltransferase n=1 Tax=Fluctibacter halophilus TaxID=226011 RepID=A0ABS8GA27_9ALTE|nr:GNAT family N-acetyltransferase [Aestuariibacter halophilus]MCC2617440.1 GNAT family N-acetyltransferase [Aestuariibacter halophilus]